MRISNAGIVDSHASDSDVSLTIGEAFGANWVGRKEEVDDSSPDDGDYMTTQ